MEMSLKNYVEMLEMTEPDHIRETTSLEIKEKFLDGETHKALIVSESRN